LAEAVEAWEEIINDTNPGAGIDYELAGLKQLIYRATHF